MFPRLNYKFCRSLIVALAVCLAAGGAVFENGANTPSSAYNLREPYLSVSPSPSKFAARDRRTVRTLIDNIPRVFEENVGQVSDRSVRFVARGVRADLWLTSDNETLRLVSSTASVGFRFIGAKMNVEAEGIDQIAGRRNYILGNDPAKWRTDVPLFKSVSYANIYPGISLKYYGNEQTIEYDLNIAPGADPRAVRLRIDGNSKLMLSADGDLVLTNKDAKLIQRRPFAYQDIDGERRPVAVRYSLARNREVTFKLGDYDRSRSLVIDPTIIYSTYLGGAGNDSGSSIAVDASNNVYIAGTTSSANFPTRGAAFPSKSGLDDIFVTKIDASGKNIVYSTYIGGSGLDRADGIAVDNNGNAYVVGRVGDTSADFPTTPGSLAPSYRGGDFDGVVFKLNPQGNALVYSTFLGGEDNDSTEGIAVDSDGNAYLTGGTRSSGFPVTSTAFQSFRAGDTDAYFTKLNPSGSAVLYSTLLGGGGTDRGSGVVVDAAGRVYIAGYTASPDFPTQNAFQGSSGGSFDAFVAKIDPAANGAASLIFSTYLGGSGDDKAFGIAIDSNANVCVAGQTSSQNFPVLNALQPLLGGFVDAFVATINSSGAKIYATYLGGSGDDRATGIAVNSAGAVYLTGYTSSTNFPVHSAAQALNGGGFDGFVAKLNPAGSALIYSTYLGGNANENTVSSITSTNPIALDTSGNAYVTGYTSSTNFPAASAIQPVFAGGQDAFVTRISDSTGGNQIDTTDFFVHQQYLDFLSREPDQNGFAFWTNNIIACGSNAQCIADRRVSVSAAFLLSIEFQQTGFLVERIYKAAYGDATATSTLGGAHQLSAPIVRFNEFLPDTRQIGSGLIVGQTGWETVLENNKQNFTTQFVQRSRFATAFPVTMTPAQFVDKLNANTGGVLSSTDRAAAIALFGSAVDTNNLTARAQALRQVAENQNLSNVEFNRAFVLMQFFGYLRRNPNDLPDADYTGFDFWLTKLNQFNGNYNAAEMVKAFIVSTEYRQRFGP
jgi:hypothetical protein